MRKRKRMVRFEKIQCPPTKTKVEKIEGRKRREKKTVCPHSPLPVMYETTIKILPEEEEEDEEEEEEECESGREGSLSIHNASLICLQNFPKVELQRILDYYCVILLYSLYK